MLARLRVVWVQIRAGLKGRGNVIEILFLFVELTKNAVKTNKQTYKCLKEILVQRGSSKNLKGELGEFQIYFRKIPLHQQNILVVSVLPNSPRLPRNFKKCPK